MALAALFSHSLLVDGRRSFIAGCDIFSNHLNEACVILRTANIQLLNGLGTVEGG